MAFVRDPDEGTVRQSAYRFNLKPESNSEEPFFVATQGRPRWRHGSTPVEGLSHEVLKGGFRDYGFHFLEQLGGEFSVTANDPESGWLLAATDRAGSRPLFYGIQTNEIVIGETATSVGLHMHGGSRLDPQGLYDYVYFHVIPAPRTVFQGVSRLLPGEFLKVEQGRVERGSYWQVDYTNVDSEKDRDRLAEEFRTLLESSVREVAEGKRVGAFLSGGTDSSSIAGMLARVSVDRARTYSIGFQAEGYDEMAYARVAANHFGTNHREYYLTPDDVVAAIPMIASHHDQPFGNASAVPAFYCARLAREDGVERLLGGDGGDELFGGNARYAKQQVFALYQHLPAWIRHGSIEPLLFRLPHADRMPFLRKLNSYVRQANIPMPDRAESYNLLERFGAQRVFTPDFLEQVNIEEPLRMLRNAYQGAQASTLLNKMLAVDMRFVIADSDLPKVTKSCELAGVEVAYPMLDDRLVEFASRLPPDLKVRRGQLRYFFKFALRDFLPKEIQKKKKQGFGLPFGVWLQDHPPLREFAYDSLAALRGRGIVRADFIDDLISHRHQEHAAYYGVLIWVLVMLEQWLASHEGTTGFRLSFQ